MIKPKKQLYNPGCLGTKNDLVKKTLVSSVDYSSWDRAESYARLRPNHGSIPDKIDRCIYFCFIRASWFQQCMAYCASYLRQRINVLHHYFQSEVQAHARSKKPTVCWEEHRYVNDTVRFDNNSGFF